ncbi:MAG TPA: ABC transporter ATP-binding protein, partial [Acidimicrobiia bacterium]|nr:ABC transporter ATP-binding protein [Acidimicrobiia bacterium]
MYGAMSDAISNITAVKAESGEEIEQEKISAIGEIVLEKNLKYARRALFFDSLLSNGINRSLRITSVAIAVVVAAGTDTNISNLYLATTLTMNFLGFLWQFSDMLGELTLYFGDAAPIVPMLEAEVAIKDRRDADELEEARGKIEIENVSFKYPNTNSYVFQDLNLTINAGERVGLVGKSGAGKSTLVKLVMRFIDTTEGEIKFDGVSARSITQESLRNNISYVAQEPMLFHRSVYQNIIYGNDRASSEDVSQVLRRAHAHEFIEELPEGIDSIVGERGVNLSGGQRQRIAIARAMLKNAPILILDEATSSLDSESEGFVQTAFEELMKDRTTLVVAHRLSTLLSMDRIIVFDQGAIAEQGTHVELVALGGIYSGLWEHQAGGFLGAE